MSIFWQDEKFYFKVIQNFIRFDKVVNTQQFSLGIQKKREGLGVICWIVMERRDKLFLLNHLNTRKQDY